MIANPRKTSAGRSSGRLLIPDDDFYALVAVVRALRAAGYEPWVARLDGRRTLASRSRATAGSVAVPDPSDDAEGFIAALAAAAGRLRVAAVLPGTESALTVLAGREPAFPPGVRLAIPPYEVVARAIDKALLARLAAEVGLRTPPTRVVSRSSLREIEFPAVVKPVTSSVAVDGRQRLGWVRRLDSAAGLEAAVADLPGDSLLVQPFLEGALCAMSGVVWEGRLVCASHQVARRIWPRHCGVSAYAQTVARDDELERRVEALLAAIGWNGLFEVQFIRRPDGHYVIDLNTRFYGSIALAIAAGLNLPAVWVDLELGRKPRVGAYRAGVRYRSEERDAHALLDAFRRGRRLEALAGALPRRRTTHGLFSARDPLPFLARLAARVLSRAGRLARRNAESA